MVSDDTIWSLQVTLTLLPEMLVIIIYVLYAIDVERVCPDNTGTLYMIICVNIISHIVSMIVIITSYCCNTLRKHIILASCLILFTFLLFCHINEYKMPLYEICENVDHYNMDVLHNLITITFVNSIVIIIFVMKIIFC